MNEARKALYQRTKKDVQLSHILPPPLSTCPSVSATDMPKRGTLILFRPIITQVHPPVTDFSTLSSLETNTTLHSISRPAFQCSTTSSSLKTHEYFQSHSIFFFFSIHHHSQRANRPFLDSIGFVAQCSCPSYPHHTLLCKLKLKLQAICH